MTSRNQDVWLWLELAAIGYYAARTVHEQLDAVRKASIINRHDQPQDKLSRQTENAIKLKTLGDLAQSPNQDIVKASVRILTDRLVQGGPAWDLMLKDIGGLNVERRDRALFVFRFTIKLVPHATFENLLQEPSTYSAIIACLCNLIPEAAIAEAESAYRSQAERDALAILVHLLDDSRTDSASLPDVITKWLKDYPFGGKGTSLEKRRDIIQDIIAGRHFYEDRDFQHSMLELLYQFDNVPRFKAEMIKHGLVLAEAKAVEEETRRFAVKTRGHPAFNNVPVGAIRSPSGTWVTSAGEISDPMDPSQRYPEDIPVGAERTADGFTYLVENQGMADGVNNRMREESFEEQALRRRRREAWVFGEAGRPIQSDDIMQRESVVAEDGIAEALEDFSGEAVEAQTAQDSSWWGWVRRLRPDGLAPLSSP